MTIGAPSGEAPQAGGSRADGRVAELAAEIDRLEQEYRHAREVDPSGPGRRYFIAESLLDRIDREALAAVAGATQRVLGACR